MGFEFEILLVFLTVLIIQFCVFQFKYNWNEIWILGFMPVFIFSGLVTLVYAHTFGEEITYYKTIVSIGGCNREACGIRYDDDSLDRHGSPVLGEKVKFHYWRRK